MSQALFLGIDFSGAAAPWKANCPNPTVWIATIEGLRLVDLCPVQDLPGAGSPFERLVFLLREGHFRAAGIDAPFSLPKAHVPPGGHLQLLAEIGEMKPASDRPFPRGADIVHYASSIAPIAAPKTWRQTERECGALARSTLWNGARPGAPFTAACLTLLAHAGRPIWPWSDATGMLVEAFPAAQLKAWGLQHSGYSAKSGVMARTKIIDGLEQRELDLTSDFRDQMRASPDALDAVIAAFAGRAAANHRLAFERPDDWALEGAIAVHA